MREKIVFISKVYSVTYLDFLRARIIHDRTLNKKVSGKVISYNFLKNIKRLFSMYLKFYQTTFCHTLLEVKELREMSNTEIKTVGHRLSFSDNSQKLKFRGPFCGPGVLPW